MSDLPRAVSLDTADASLALLGGKGKSLARLIAAGLPVPGGMVLTTRLYREFIDTYQLHERIQRSLGDNEAERASHEIHMLFDEAVMPDVLAAVILEVPFLHTSHTSKVAVRSSATAEDLPGLSFAGQQDTYLNVPVGEALLAAVKNCWASLWSARAISYRTRMGIDHREVAIAVVIQEMYDADVSGILFTANPATGNPAELMLNASYGLGESIVGGEITPDSFTISRHSLAVTDRVISEKTRMTVSRSAEGTEFQQVEATRRGEASVSDEEIEALCRLALRAEDVFGVPQDIEWLIADGECLLLQSRPITNLPFYATWDAPYEGAQLMRRQVVENMPQPLSPLFDELYLSRGLEGSIDKWMADMGLPLDIGDFVNRPLFVTVNGYGYIKYEFHPDWSLLKRVPRILVWYVRKLPWILRNLTSLWEDGLGAYRHVTHHWRAVDSKACTDEELVGGIRDLAAADANYWFSITMMVGAAKITEGMLNWFVSSRMVKGELTSGMFLTGFPSKTLEAQQDLEGVAEMILARDALASVVTGTPADELAEVISSDPAFSEVNERVRTHLQEYGHQVYDLDFVEPTQAEDPAPVMLGLKGLVQNPGGKAEERQAEMVLAREQLIEKTRCSLGPVRRWIFNKLLTWAQTYGPYREEALFYMGSGWPALRRLAAELGRRLVEKDVFDSPEDVYYLTSDELLMASGDGENGFRQLVKDRRTLREARKQLHPPGRVPPDVRYKVGFLDVTRFFEMWETQKLNDPDSGTLEGFAVSPGKIRGTASVIMSPENFAAMRPGSILVCPTTTPAWTPLFVHATGLVTDIGALLAHGSIVAREYGIPAVLGTGNATARIQDGQQIEVDGSVGTVTILED